MSIERVSKFGVLKGLQQSSKLANPQTSGLPQESPLQEVRFTNYLDAEISRRLQIHVAQLKSRKIRGGERISIKSVLHQALAEYLERHGG